MAVLIDEELMERFRRAQRCELCGRPTPHGCDPAHLMGRGAGRVDVPCNLASLCRECHNKTHADVKFKRRLWIMVYNREKQGPLRIVWGIRRMTDAQAKRAGIGPGKIIRFGPRGVFGSEPNDLPAHQAKPRARGRHDGMEADQGGWVEL